MSLPAFIRAKETAVVAGVMLISAGITFPTAQAQQKHSTAPPSLPNGVYLYGSSSQPNQMAQDYVVFQRYNNKVVGAFYSPHSEFECFAGTLKGNALDVKSIKADATQAVEVKTKLANLHRIPTISANERQILSLCKKATVAIASDR